MATKRQKQIVEHFIKSESRKALREANEINVQELVDLTDGNDHSGAVLALAKMLKHTQYVKIASAIVQIHNAEGSMPDSISTYRSQILKKLLAVVEQKYGNEVRNQVHGAF